MKVITEGRIPVKMWLDDIEDGALQQAINLSNLPFAVRHIAIMPDCHQGYGMCIGGVLAVKDVVIPNAVGVDIACGVCAVKTSIQADSLDRETLKRILSEIRKVIPVGFNKHKTEDSTYNYFIMPDGFTDLDIASREFKNARLSLGTLGGGNHFLELQRDEDGLLWVMIHSGSRNLGYKVAGYYNKLAIDLNEKWHSKVPKEWELAFLPLDSEEGNQYLAEMNYCVEYAFANRKLMMDKTIKVLANVLDTSIPFVEESMINIAHNYAAMENHSGQNVMVHRKGATRARAGEIGIIPGSQGAPSFIVEGLGNPESFMSCSHGAGRKMGRKQAKRELSLEDEQANLDRLGVLHSVRGKDSLDEAPGAYKDILDVMESQKDLVKIIMRLEPLAVLKG